MAQKTDIRKPSSKLKTPPSSPLFQDIDQLIEETRRHIAQYLTELPPKETLEDRLRKAIKIARENLLKSTLIHDE